MIWSRGFQPRLISLHYANNTFDQHGPLSRESSHSAGPTRSPSTPPSPGQLEPIDSPTPAAFSTCRASRAIARSKGYQTWRMIRCDGKVRGFLWDPLIDTTLFAEPKDIYFGLFMQQFLAQASKIQTEPCSAA